jgi:hypothetical protein
MAQQTTGVSEMTWKEEAREVRLAICRAWKPIAAAIAVGGFLVTWPESLENLKKARNEWWWWPVFFSSAFALMLPLISWGSRAAARATKKQTAAIASEQQQRLADSDRALAGLREMIEAQRIVMEAQRTETRHALHLLVSLAQAERQLGDMNAVLGQEAMYYAHIGAIAEAGGGGDETSRTINARKARSHMEEFSRQLAPFFAMANVDPPAIGGQVELTHRGQLLECAGRAHRELAARAIAARENLAQQVRLQ